MEQRSKAWFDARLGKATASRFGDILARTKTGEGASRKNYRTQLVIERLTGVVEESYTNAAMQWGIDHEEDGVVQYMLVTGNDTQEVAFIEHPGKLAGASPDRLIGDDGVLEIKCPNSATHIETLKSDSLPSRYKPQVQGQLWITGRKWCDFVSYDPRMPTDLQLVIIRVERDGEYIAELDKEVTKFLNEVEEEVELINSRVKRESKITSPA